MCKLYNIYQFNNLTYPDFENIHASLSKQVPNVPVLPEKMLLKLNYAQIEQRKLDLEKYLQECVKRRDIMQTKQFKDFISLIEQIPDQIDVDMVYEFKDHDMPAIDAHYIPDKQVMFVLLSKSNIEAKVKGFFSGFLGSSSKGDIFGRVVAYRSQFKNKEFSKMWDRNFESPPSVMHYDPLLTLLAVGLENGQIQVLRIQTERNYSKYDEFCIIKKHTEKVTGIAFDHRTATMFSIAKDKCLLATDISQNDNHYKCDEYVFKTPIYAMNYDKSSKVIYVGCDKGIVHIFSTENRTLARIAEVQPIQSGSNIGFRSFFNSKSSYLLGGTLAGNIKVYELKKPGKEKYTNSISNIELSSCIKSVSFDLSLREIYCSFNNSVLIIDSRSGSCIKSINAHYESCNRIQFLEDRKLLITAGGDKCVKIWKVRPGTGIKDEEEEEPEVIEKPKKQIKEIEKQKDRARDEYEEDTRKEHKILVVEESKFDNIEGIYQSRQDDDESRKLDKQKEKQRKMETDLFTIQQQQKQKYQDDDDDIYGWDIQKKEPVNQTSGNQNSQKLTSKQEDSDHENDMTGWSNM